MPSLVGAKSKRGRLDEGAQRVGTAWKPWLSQKASHIGFLMYARCDVTLRERFEVHLAPLKERGILVWNDGRIEPGEEWDRSIRRALDTSTLILILVTEGLLKSGYIRRVELKKAMERHRLGQARVVPILLGPCDWRQAPFRTLQVVPRDAKPILDHSDIETAFADVVREIAALVDTTSAPLPEGHVKQPHSKRALGWIILMLAALLAACWVLVKPIAPRGGNKAIQASASGPVHGVSASVTRIDQIPVSATEEPMTGAVGKVEITVVGALDPAWKIGLYVNRGLGYGWELYDPVSKGGGHWVAHGVKFRVPLTVREGEAEIRVVIAKELSTAPPQSQGDSVVTSRTVKVAAPSIQIDDICEEPVSRMRLTCAPLTMRGKARNILAEEETVCIVLTPAVGAEPGPLSLLSEGGENWVATDPLDGALPAGGTASVSFGFGQAGSCGPPTKALPITLTGKGAIR